MQRGNIGAALPLYERALAIWEAASGADSPDVAHTLTDIAVIHLEQVGVKC
jgi:centrosomal protein CEP104